MKQDVSRVLAGMLARNGGPDPDNPPHHRPGKYSVMATLDGEALRVRLTFLGGAVYCCFEPGCHLWLPTGERWGELRREFARCRVKAPPRLRVALRAVVQAGALSFDFSRRDRRFRGWYAFRGEERSWSYRAQRTEGKGPRPTARRAPAGDGTARPA